MSPELYREQISGTGPCAFFLHGMLSSRLQWEPNLPRLARHLRPVLFDLWGHGSSPSPLDETHYTVEALTAQIEHARLELGESSLVMVGQSFGAGLAMQYALRHPDRVQALVFTNTQSALGGHDSDVMRNFQQKMAARIETSGAEAIRELPMHPRWGRRLPGSLKERLVATADAVSPQAVARLMRITAPQLSVLKQLPQLSCPVLLTNGRHESAFQPLRDLAVQSIPNCEVIDLNAGHAVNLEAIYGFDSAVCTFVDATKR